MKSEKNRQKTAMAILFAVAMIASISVVISPVMANSNASSERTLPPTTPPTLSLAPGYCPSSGGDHSFESIQSVSCTQNPGGTLTITVIIWIANPGGCVAGEPCPDYDVSPEYINAWIDWDGDGIFESDERVLDKDLTGYLGINYYGTMSTSNIVTIPAEAVSSTWMRVNLGWDHDPNDPCEEYWTWGDVVEKEVELLNIKVVQLDALNDVAIKDISDPIWKKQFDADGNLEDVTPKEDDPIADDMKSGSFKIKATLDASPNKPSWNPKVSYKWDIYSVIPNTKAESGTGEFTGWNGEFDTTLPQKVGQYNLFLELTFKDNQNNIIGSQSIDRKLYITYAKPIFPQPKEKWLEYSTKWANSAKNEEEVASNMVHGIYSNPGPGWTWTYDPGLSTGEINTWEWDKPLISHTGDCRVYSHFWASLCKVLGVNTNSKKIVYAELRYYGIPYWRTFLPFVTKHFTSLQGNDGQEWGFDFHQIGSNRGIYDPVLNIVAPSNKEYRKQMIKKFAGFTDAQSNSLIEKGETSDGTRSWKVINCIGWPADPPTTTKLMDLDTDTALLLSTDKYRYYLNEPMTITGGVINKGTPLSGIIIEAEIKRPGGVTDNILLYDDASHGDVQADDGIYCNLYTDTPIYGNYDITAHASGMVDGNYFEKEAKVSVGVQGIEAELTDVYSDSGVDVDSDNLYNYLSSEVGVSITKPGEYNLRGLLKSNNIEIAWANSTIDLGIGNYKITLSFDGSTIRKSKINGPYTLGITLYDKNYNQIDYKEFTTSAYSYTDFQQPLASFRDIYSDYGMDTDGDGLYNYLTTEAEVSVLAPGTYTILGWLSDSSEESDIIWDSGDFYLDAGVQSMQLNFDGIAIYKHGTDGPYTLSYLALYDENDKLIDYQYDAYTTSAYSYTDFQKPEELLVALTGNYNDYATDIDSDGVFDYLTVDAEVILVNPGYCIIKARLMDTNEEEIVWAENTAYLEADTPQIIQLNFDGKEIYNHGVNGPYYLRDVYIYHTGDPDQSDYVYDAYTTAPYSYTEFGKMCGDVNGDGKVTMSDVRKVFNRYLDPNYPLDLPWAADVNGDGKVTMSDVRKVFNRYLDPGYELNCCCEEVE